MVQNENENLGPHPPTHLGRSLDNITNPDTEENFDSFDPNFKPKINVVNGSNSNLSNHNKKNKYGGSLSRIQVPGVKNRCVSEAHIPKLSKRELSASNFAALSHGHLSLKAATPARSYNSPNSPIAASKRQFESKVRRYYHQISVGCQNNKCTNVFCKSSPDGPQLKPDLATIMCIQLASRQKTFFCKGSHHEEQVIPIEVFSKDYNNPGKPKPFLHSVFSATPFASLFSIKQPSDDNASSSNTNETAIEEPALSGHQAENISLQTNLTKRSKSAIRISYEEGTRTKLEPSESLSCINYPFEEEIEQFSLRFLTLETLNEAILTYHECNDDAFLMNTIRTVFSSSECLNESFRVNDETEYDSGVDLNSVSAAFDLLKNLNADKFKNTLINAIEILVAHLAVTSIQRSMLPQLVIILEFPLLRNPVYHETLVRKLCKIMSELPQSSALRMKHWLSRYEPSRFENLILIFRQYVSMHHHQHQRPDVYMIGSLRSLQLLYEANEIALNELGERVIDNSLFYTPTVSKKIDFKEEYQIWKKPKNMDRRASASIRQTFFEYPFIFDPAAKARILHIDAVVQMSQVFEDAFVHSAWVFQAQKILEDSSKNVSVKGALKNATCPYLVLEIRRDHLMEDTLAHLTSKSKHDLKKPLKVKYVGSGEEGLDMGGVQKEFFQTIIESVFDTAIGMFTYNEETRNFWINSHSLESLREFELVGILLGLAIYNGIIMDIKFPIVLYKKLLGLEPTLHDLKQSQPRLGKSLQQLLDWDPINGSVEDVFCYTFQIVDVQYGETKYIDLIPNGGDLPVTDQNKNEFVKLYVDHLLSSSIKKQFERFSRGFHRVCGGSALSLCTSEELEVLICGSPELDFVALEKTATYDDGYHANHRTIKMFWSVVRKYNGEQKKQLLHFVTGSDRAPITGLSNMTFVIQRNGPDSDRLPTALTCFSRLLLPEYTSLSKLKNRLTTAIENGKGFGLV